MEVNAVPQLLSDIEGLQTLFMAELPPRRVAQPSGSATVIYGFCDASGRGFGSTLLIDNVIHYRHGQWSNSYSAAS
jgi:hypothetical protein